MSPISKSRKTRHTPTRSHQGPQELSFPIIANAIERLYRSDLNNFVSKREIVPLVLRDPRSSERVHELYLRTPKKLSLEKYAGNLVQWFSQRWTAGDQKWSSLFSKLERSDAKIDDCWAYRPIEPSAVVSFPDEVEEEEAKKLPEGALFRKLVNAYERNPEARQLCIKKFGTSCFICRFSFGETYGEVATGFIHIHHLRQLSTVGKDYKVDPIVDLRPVCPNCHAVIHHRSPAYSIEEMKSLLSNSRKK